MANRWQLLAIRTALLFALSMVLVFGFWEHRNFYQYGLYNLLLVGGLVTFLVILAFRVALSGEIPHGRARGSLAFSLDEADRLRRGLVDLTIRPADEKGLPAAGQIVRARTDTGLEVGRLRVRDGTRARLADVTDETARRAGYGSAEDLRKAGAQRWGWKPADLVAVLTVEPVGARP